MVAPAHLKSLQALEMAVRTGSLAAAAELLGITPAAVGQRVKTLEDFLGVQLLERGRAGIRPSAELNAALPHLRSGFADLETAARELELQRGREIHVAAMSDFAELWLRPRLPRFRALHPHILFCINGEGDAPARLGKIDCEIGYGEVREDGHSALLFRDFVLPVSSPVNFERTAHLPARTRLEGFPLLHLDFYRNDPAGISWPAWCLRNAIERTAPERGIRFQQIAPALDAIAANAGIALCGLALISERVHEGSFATLYPPDTGIWTDYAYVAKYRDGGRQHVSRFRDWLAAEARATASWLQAAAAS